MAVRHRGAFTIDFNLLASSPICPWHEAAVSEVVSCRGFSKRRRRFYPALSSTSRRLSHRPVFATLNGGVSKLVENRKWRYLRLELPQANPAHAQAIVSIAAEHLSMTKEARQFARIVGEAEDTYMPSYPPMSPVTTSHFAMWSLFDVQFGQSRETIGTCFLLIAELTEMPVGLRTTVAALQASRLGIYMHCGHEGRFVRLREIGTETAILCLVPAGYRGDVGEVWLARLLPPATALFGYHVVATTPYIVRGGAEAQWVAYLVRERQRICSKIPVRKMDATSYIMKHGPSANHWNEYIFCAYTGHCKEAVFLTGVPDIKESLPHA